MSLFFYKKLEFDKKIEIWYYKYWVKWIIVLIVAKCIVNMLKSLMTNNKLPVLIVAKCIVNVTLCCECPVVLLVLIVAKCIVN